MSGLTQGNVCRACGLCCDGTFFARGTLRPEEVDASRHRLPVIEHEGRPSFPQPCAHHEGERCAIYASRPGCCRDYRCRLLRRLDDQEISLDEAEKYIGRVRTLASGLRAALDDEHLAKPLVTVAGELATLSENVSWRRAHADLLLDVGELTQISRRQFGVRDDAMDG